MLYFDKRSVIEEDTLAARLVEMGYEKTWQVEAPGQFSIRGGIIDVFDMTEENPLSHRTVGDSVDSIRSFDVLSQRSVETLDHVFFIRRVEMVLFQTAQGGRLCADR